MTMNITKGRIIFIRSSFLSECKNVQKSALKKCKRANICKIDFPVLCIFFF